MYDSGHKEGEAELRSALQRLDEAVARHEALLVHAGKGSPADSLKILESSIEMMRQEADRLRCALAQA